MWERLSISWERIAGYNPALVAVELLIIGSVVFAVVRFVQGTRAAGVLKGLLVLLLLAFFLRLAGGDNFQRLAVLYDRFLALVAVALVIIFQPELRRALVRLGETPFLRSSPKDVQVIVGEIAQACGYLARARFGALIVLERGTGLSGVVEGGTVLDARLTAPLLKTIFFPGSALHDLAVIVKGRTLHAAGVQLPLAEPGEMPEPLGSRHRAAVGVSKECDAIVVVVSEETGAIRIAERGRLSSPMALDDFQDELTARLTRALRQPTAPRPAASDETALDASPHGHGSNEHVPHDAPVPDTPSGDTLTGAPALRDEPLGEEGPDRTNRSAAAG